MSTIEDHMPVAVSKADFDSLDEYSTTIPTGTLPGKWWKRRRRHSRDCNDWMLGAYAHEPNEDGTITIHWRRLVWYPWIDDGEPEYADDLPARRTEWTPEEIRALR